MGSPSRLNSSLPQSRRSLDRNSSSATSTKLEISSGWLAAQPALRSFLDFGWRVPDGFLTQVDLSEILSFFFKFFRFLIRVFFSFVFWFFSLARGDLALFRCRFSGGAACGTHERFLV